MSSEHLAACPNPWCHSHSREMPLTVLGIAETPICYGRIGFRVRCNDCGLHGPTVEKKIDAYPAWNTRATAPTRDGEVGIRSALTMLVEYAEQLEGPGGSTYTALARAALATQAERV